MQRTRLLSLLLLAACHHDMDPTPRRPELRVASVSLPSLSPEPEPEPEPVPVPVPAPVPAPAPAPAAIERFPVPKDTPTSVVRARAGATSRIVFLPGLCSNAYAYLYTFPEAARAHGGVVAIEGDRPCGAADSGFRSFTWSAPLQRGRIDAALTASGALAPSDGFTLVGYSAGASIAQLVHEKWPELFPRLVLIAPPDDPSVERLAKARGVVNMSCTRDVPGRMRTATTRLRAKGVPSIYLEMPGCTHGQVAEPERLFGEAFDWLEVAAP